MANKIKGLTIEIGGETTGLQKALGEVNKNSRDLKSELREVDRLLKLDPKNTELVAQKQKILAEAVENSKKKLDTLKEAERQAQEQFKRGEIGEDQYRAIQREVIKAEQELKKFEKQLRETGITAEQVGKKMQDAGQKMTDVGKKMSTYVTAPIVAAGAASFKMAADLQDAMGATDQIFKRAADSVKSWADNLESYYGIAEGEALEYANMMGSMLVNIGGLTEEQAAKQAQTLIELAGDLTAMYGGTTADAVRALTGALKGNNTMLDNYGMAANDAMIKTKALEMGLIGEGQQLDLASKQAATLALIMEQTADAQGQAAREADGASGSTRALTTELKNLAGELGEQLLPILTPFISNLKDIIKKFSELSPETKENIVKIGLLVAAIGPALVIIGKLITIVGTITSLFGKLMPVVKVVGLAIGGISAPVAIAIGAIAAIIAIGVALWKNWDTVKEKAGQLGKYIKEKFNAIKEAIMTPIRNAVSFVKEQIEKIKGFFNFRVSLPKIKLPHFSITPKGWGLGDLLKGKIPKLGISWYAEGGIFSSPSIIGVGEGKSKEAVIPIDKLPGMIAEALKKANGVQASPVITGNNFYVREESDIRKVALELYNLQLAGARARGGR